MAAALTEFRVSDLYSSDDIQNSLGVGNAGGVRICLDDQSNVRRMAILTSLPNARQPGENPYHDRMEGQILVYTGAGREGDQSLAGINKRIPQQLNHSFPIYGFQLIGSRRDKAIGQKRWRFLGLLEYVRHYPESQLDVRRQIRQVWIFEFYVHAEVLALPIANDGLVARELLQASRSAAPEDREVIELTSSNRVPSIKTPAIEIESERRRLLSLSPQDFEVVIRNVLVSTGFKDVAVTRFSQDGGIDLNAYTGELMWPIRDLLIQVQAKRWLHTVGRKEVAELRGSLQPFARGAVVTQRPQ